MASTDPQEAERKEYSAFLQALGARIRAMRKDRGWTYRDMVMRHGFHLSAHGLLTWTSEPERTARMAE